MFSLFKQEQETLAKLEAKGIDRVSGCVLYVDADLSVNEDATATGEMTIAISSEISGLLGLGSGVDLVDQLEQGMLDGAEGVEDLDCEPAEQENAVAMVCSFENQVFDQADDIWNIYASDDNTVTFYSSSGEQAAEEEDAGLFDDLVDFDFGGYQIDVEMPGPIVSVDGTNVDQTSDTSFRIEAGLNDSFEAIVVSEDGSGDRGADEPRAPMRLELQRSTGAIRDTRGAVFRTHCSWPTRYPVHSYYADGFPALRARTNIGADSLGLHHYRFGSCDACAMCSSKIYRSAIYSLYIWYHRTSEGSSARQRWSCCCSELFNESCL